MCISPATVKYDGIRQGRGGINMENISKYYVTYGSGLVCFSPDDTPLGNLLNWMAVKGSSNPNYWKVGTCLVSTYRTVLSLQVL